jgi:uncharacterized protein YgiM (DUF1202 family)
MIAPRACFALLLAASLATGCASAPPPPPPPAPDPEPEMEPAPAAPSERPTYVVKADKTQLRDDPTTKSIVLGRVSKGTRVTGMKEKDGWVFVRLEDKRVGWIRADLLRKEPPAAESAKPKSPQ